MSQYPQAEPCAANTRAAKDTAPLLDNHGRPQLSL